MCRLIAITCDRFLSPMEAVRGLSAMHERYDGSTLGLLLRDLGGPFKTMKDAPILSGIFSSQGLKQLDHYMLRRGFTTKYKISFKLQPSPPPGTPRRDVYLVRTYDPPAEYDELSRADRNDQFMRLSLELKTMGIARRDMLIFSFWPDTVVIKEIGDPLALAQYLNLDHKALKARIIMAQSRQNASRDADLYDSHPSFLQGYATMADGENTAMGPNREFLMSRGFPGYNGYPSDSEIFTHCLHFTISRMGLDIGEFKHVVTPLDQSSLKAHPDARFLTQLKYACRHLIIDGPNCIVGCLPDNTLFMTQDKKKLRSGVVGGEPGKFVFASEVCGLDAVFPGRIHSRDFEPMHQDTVAVTSDRRGLTIFRQSDGLLSN